MLNFKIRDLLVGERKQVEKFSIRYSVSESRSRQGRAMSQSALTAVVANVRNLAVQETTFLRGVTLEVGFLKDELIRLQDYLKDIDTKWRSGNATVAVLVTQIRDAAYDAENVIEAADYMEKRNRLKNGFMGAVSRYARLPYDLITLHKVGVKIQHVRRKLSEIFQSAERLKIVDLGDTTMDNVHAEDDFRQDFEDDVVLVGFEDEHKEIVDKLVEEEASLSVVSIVAIGGAGKTTLARKVYTSSTVKQHFQTVAWVTVSQTFKGIDLLKDIMKQISDEKEESIDQMNEYQMGKKISEFLSQKRYLIVLHDVWEADTWEQINRTVTAVPDAKNGSRVLLTTRKEDVARHVEMSTHVHALKHLDEQKSWELFSSKALPSYRRSVIRDHVDEFEKLGMQLARKCDGLPLALAVLGGYLSKNLNTQAWSDVLLGWPSTKSIGCASSDVEVGRDSFPLFRQNLGEMLRCSERQGRYCTFHTLADEARSLIIMCKVKPKTELLSVWALGKASAPNI